MLFLALAVACSLAIGMLFKYAGREGLDRTALLTANYAAAVGVALVLLAAGGRTVAEGLRLSTPLLTLGVGTGALLIAGFFMLSLATDVAGMSLAIGVMRVSVVIPFLASWAVWNEVPTLAQGIGVVVAGVSFFLIARREPAPKPAPAGAPADTGEPTGPSDTIPADDPLGPSAESATRVFVVLAGTFCTGGAVDVAMKTFEEGFGGTNSRVLFLLLAFGVAFLIGAALVVGRGLRSGTWPERRTLGWGVVLGVINYGSLEFILRAIEVLPGTFVFPANNIAIVLLGAVLGVVVWDEHLSRLNRIGLALAAVALALLSA
jgi:drug/metabolite transporter (DMT)-like permease